MESQGLNAHSSSDAQSPWQQKVQVTAYGFDEAYPKVWLIFEALCLVALLGFFVWSCFIRQPRGDPKKPLPIKAVIAARMMNIITLFLGIFKATVQQSYVVVSMLNQIFYLIAVMLGFYIFWKLIQKLLERLAEEKPSKAFALVAITHWILLGMLSALSAAECALYIAFITKGINVGEGYMKLAYEYNKVSAALSILCWIASMEVLGWIIFIFVSAAPDRRAGLAPLSVGSFFFFLINFILAILQIIYVLEQNMAPEYLDAARTIIEFFCTMGIYTGVLLCFRKWHHVHISPPQKILEAGGDEREVSEEDCNSSLRSYHSMVYSQQQEQLRYSFPQGAASAQQVHMYMPR
ncbi:uncharacterized protein ACHE_60274A [Aspergillus chevalieri]|uniref:Integral membrane protein n=1 Tax=Aspergillus chevalieri TaxID=182096 RepID=A0A7R7VT84_ASPCH|nr:uncharacterized protein ACHE_60274A [Aspergillus chevalieri]BCR90388.1 hypothetical protein ACHE_60274A [Aspergillus chevalieri]